MCYGGYSDLSDDRRPPLMTHAKYLDRAKRWAQLNARSFNSAEAKKETLWNECFSVNGHSILTELGPEFDIVDDTLLDMMHIGQGVVSGHIIPMLKTPARLSGHDEKHPELVVHRARYCIPQAGRDKLEAYYKEIQAPIGIAPMSKAPFQRSGEMTAHHWLNFTKVYGKYLFVEHFGKLDATIQAEFEPLPDPRLTSQAHLRKEIERRANLPPPDNPSLRALCRLLDILELCYRSHATAEVKKATAVQIREFADHVEQLIPITEHAIVLHNLFFHIPATIKRWGPTRGYWCFPFER
jgi:hypothetical protein